MSNYSRMEKDSIGVSEPSEVPKLNDEIKSEEMKVMITPCCHAYHKECLQDWMTKRLNCPMCRADLPPCDKDVSYCCWSYADANNHMYFIKIRQWISLFFQFGHYISKKIFHNFLFLILFICQFQHL